MSKLLAQFRQSQGLLGAIDAMTNRRAFITLFGTFAVAVLLVAAVSAGITSLVLGGQFGLSKLVGLVGVLLTFVVVLVGVSASGILVNDSVRARAQRGIAQALGQTAATAHRLLGVLIALGVLALLVLVAALVVIFLCKLPLVGPLLYTLAIPVCVVLLGTVFYAGFFVVALHGPAIWEGHTVFRAVAVLGAIFRQRLFSVIIQSILLTLLLVLVALLVLGCIGVGVSLTGTMSSVVLGQGLGSMNPMSMYGSMMGGAAASEGATYVKAAMFGMALLMGIAFTAIALVGIAGSCIIFANVSEDLPAPDAQAQAPGGAPFGSPQAPSPGATWGGAVAGAGLGTEPTFHPPAEPSAVVPVAAAPVAPVAPSPEPSPEPPVAAAPVAAAALHCPQCAAPITPEDTFCGHCGQRIGTV